MEKEWVRVTFVQDQRMRTPSFAEWLNSRNIGPSEIVILRTTPADPETKCPLQRASEALIFIPKRMVVTTEISVSYI
jgi:hypothetical protein